MYQFTDDCRIGVTEIDQEHEHLFSLINQAYDLLASEDADLRLTAQTLLHQLKEYANTHFAHEEAYMKKIGDPELESQKQEHADFIAYINTINIGYLDNTRVKPALKSMLDYLSRWLFRHIIGSDTLIGKFESPFAFTSKYLTGIEIVDTEHKRLFEIIKDANDVIHAELLHDKYDEIMRILSDLKEYTEVHFQDEEAYMESIGYTGLNEQKAAHTTFIDKLASINLDELDDNQQEYLEDLISFLLNWLTTHILHMDKKIPN
ncbi:MAG: bacteriohemerythrin [Lachnospiraceae bacterium]|nr:bacteriohemerythrin [Lachnospiraceae bacterium]